MKKLSEYKDFKTLIFLFSIEAVLLIVLLVVAHFSSVKTVEQCTDYEQIFLSMNTVKNNPRDFLDGPVVKTLCY